VVLSAEGPGFWTRAINKMRMEESGTVHKHGNLLAHAPERLHEEITAMRSRLRDLVESYLENDLLRSMWVAVRTAKPIRSISVDITLRCNLRCTGCYFFSEGMDKSRDADAETFEAFVADEVARGTNFVTVIGGESSLALSRLRWLYGSF